MLSISEASAASGPMTGVDFGRSRVSVGRKLTLESCATRFMKVNRVPGRRSSNRWSSLCTGRLAFRHHGARSRHLPLLGPLRLEKLHDCFKHVATRFRLDGQTLNVIAGPDKHARFFTAKHADGTFSFHWFLFSVGFRHKQAFKSSWSSIALDGPEIGLPYPGTCRAGHGQSLHDGPGSIADGQFSGSRSIASCLHAHLRPNRRQPH